MQRPKEILVVGGGPAGICAALASVSENCRVTLLEQNEKIGKKLYITGKGRCNLTNVCSHEFFFEQIMHNARFMYSAFSAFDQNDLMALIEENGCPLKIERGNRVFPESDKSSDIIKAFGKALRRAGVLVCCGKAVREIITDQSQDRKVAAVQLQNGQIFPCDAVVLATGGISYRSTGSDGSGLIMAEKLGHRIIACRPALVGLITKDKWPAQMQGLSLKNAGLTLYKKGKAISKEQGEMLFTHFGVSGPMVLTASSRMDGDPRDYSMAIDLKPALNEEQVHNRLMRDFEKYANKQFINGLGDLLPSKMIPVFAGATGIPFEKRINQISKKERRNIEILLKHWLFAIEDFAPVDTAIITSGGVNVREIDPKTMESRKIHNLFFAGEMIDMDALTGGFNIQIAASTGWLAGKSIRKRCENADCH